MARKHPGQQPLGLFKFDIFGFAVYLLFIIVCDVLFCVANCHPNEPTKVNSPSPLAFSLGQKFGAPFYKTFIDVAK